MENIPVSSSRIRNSVVIKTTCLVLFFIAFFGLKILPIKQTQWDFIVFPFFAFTIIRYIRWNNLYSKFIIIYSLFVAASCFYSHLYNHQALSLVVFHSYKYFALLFFFYLMHTKPTIAEAEQILLRIAIICCFCYIIQWIIYPNVIFYSAEEGRGASEYEYRARIPGSISCYCILLYGINKFILDHKLKYIFYSILGFIPIIIMGFRSLVFLTAATAFLMIPFIVRTGKKTLLYISLGAAITIGVLQTDLVQSKMDEMISRQESEQTFENKDYIRYLEFDYYWEDYFNKPGEKFFGGGVPVDMATKYRKEIYYNNFAWSDLGLIGLSMIIGIPAVSILILLYLICLLRNEEPQIQYLRFTLILVLLGSFTTAELYREGNILLFSLYLYIEYQYHRSGSISSSKNTM